MTERYTGGTGQGWEVRSGGGRPVQVLPLDDVIPHREGADCPCRPRVEEQGWLVIHTSGDGREADEPGAHGPRRES